MAGLRRLFHRLRNLLRPALAEAELSREVQAHLALVEDDLSKRGVAPADLRDAARRSFGGVEQAKERQRDARSIRWLEDLRRDMRFAVRSLSRHPSFVCVVVFTLALGIGATTAVFSVVNAVLIHPLAFPQGERLVKVYEHLPADRSPSRKAGRFPGMDLRELTALKARARTLSHVTVHGLALVSLAGGADTVRRELSAVNAAAFPMLGVQPLIGRWFTEEEEQPGRDGVIVLSYAAWQRFFAGDAQALGKTVSFNGNTFAQGTAVGDAYKVVGIMPRSFHFPDDDTEFWIPARLEVPPAGRPVRRTLTARLADGASAADAAREAAAIAREARGDSSASPNTGSEPQFDFVRVQDEVGLPVRAAVLTLLAAVVCLLLIVCANVASLLLSRATAREREIAARIALGAGRGRLLRQLLTESVLLALVGGFGGMALAALGLRVFRGLATDLGRFDLGALGGTFPRLDAMTVDRTVLGMTLLFSVGAALLFGIMPALRQAMPGTQQLLRALGGTTSQRARFGTRINLQGALVVAELALATMLFVGAGLLARSFVALANVDPGYDSSNVLTFQVSLPGSQRPVGDLRAFAERVDDSMRALPGVQSSAYANQLPMVAIENSQVLTRTPTAAPDFSRGADVRLVSRDFMKTLGIRVRAGRPFGPADVAGQPRVLMVNRLLAARDFADGSPIGVTVFFARDPVPWEIVGVVDDVKQRGFDEAPRPQVFVNIEQWTSPGIPVFPLGAYYALRTSVEPQSLLPQVRALIAQIDPRASLENIATMDQIVANRIRRSRMYAVLLSLFAGVAVVVAAAGIYGVMSHSVAQRSREFGIRCALGASAGTVMKQTMGQSAKLTLTGIAIGLLGAAALTRYLGSMLFNVRALDPPTFAAVGVFFALIALAASVGPARRATKLDPLIAIRGD